MLKEKFKAIKVMLFGSLARGDFNRWSDIDLAVWGIPAGSFYMAVGKAVDVRCKYRLDLVDVTDCSEALRECIKREGIEL